MNDELSIGIPELEVISGGKFDKKSIVFLIGPSEINIKELVYRIAIENIDQKGLIFAESTRTPQDIQKDMIRRGYYANFEGNNFVWVDYYSWNTQPDISKLEKEENIYRCTRDVSSLLLGIIKATKQLSSFGRIDAVLSLFPSLIIDMSDDEIYHKMSELFAKLKDAEVRSFFVITDEVWSRIKNIGINSLVDYEINFQKVQEKNQIRINKSPYSEFYTEWFDFTIQDGPKIDISPKTKNIVIALNLIHELFVETSASISDNVFSDSIRLLSHEYPFLKEVDIKKSMSENLLRIRDTITSDAVLDIANTVVSNVIEKTDGNNTIIKTIKEILNAQIQSVEEGKLKSGFVETLFKLESGSIFYKK